MGADIQENATGYIHLIYYRGNNWNDDAPVEFTVIGEVYIKPDAIQHMAEFIENDRYWTRVFVGDAERCYIVRESANTIAWIAQAIESQEKNA